MSTTRPLRLGALGLLSALLAVPFLALTPSTAQAAELSPAGQRAFQEIASCVAENNVLLASIVVDESGSLKQSDPDAKRASAVTAIVDALAELKRSGGDDVTVEANLALFGKSYTTLVGWGPVTGNHGDDLRRAARDRLGDLAPWTDYREALNGAQDSINSRAGALDKRKPCSIILWFTDGRLDVSDRTEAAREQICALKGIADSIRAAGTHVIALALFSNDKSIPQSDRVSEKERQQLRATAEGTGDGTKCGTAPIPDSSAAGAYLSATDAAQLRRLFAGAGALIQGGTDGGELKNTNGTIEIPVDQALAGFRIVFESKEAGAAALIAPGARGKFDPIGGSGSIAGVSVESSGRDGLYVTTVTADTAPIAGTWTLRAKTDTLTLLDLYYFWGTALEITAPEGVIQGAQNTVVIKPQKKGVADRPEWFAPFQLTTTVDGKSVPATAVGDGTFTVPVDLSTGGGRTAVTIGATAEATTVEQGLKLGPISSTAKLTTRLPVGFPSIDPAALELGRFSQDGSAQGTLTLRGVPEGESQICLAPASAWDRAPEGVTLTLANDSGSKDGCMTLAIDETRTVGLALTSDAPGDGPIEGHIPATFKGANTDKTYELGIPVSASMFRPVNEPLRWIYVALFSAIALVLAWLVAWVARNLTDRYQLGRALYTASIGVRLTPDGIQRSDMGASPGSKVVTTDDFEPVADRGTQSQFSARGLDFKRRGPLWWPWKPYRAVAVTPGGAVATVKGALDRNVVTPVLETGRGAPTSFSPTLHAYLSASSATEDAEGPIDARLVVLANPDASGSLRARVDKWNADLRSASVGGIEWAAIHTALRDSLAQPAAADSKPKWVSPLGRRQDTAMPTTSPDDSLVVASDAGSYDPPPDFFASGESASGQVSPPPPTSTGPKRKPKPKDAPPTPPSQPGSAAPPDYF